MNAIVSYSEKQLQLIRNTVCKDCNPDEFNLFTEVCRRVGLDPFRKQIYLTIYNKDKSTRSMVIMTGIDGMRAVANRSECYRPDEDEPEIVFDEHLVNPDTNPLGIEKAIVRVHKADKWGKWHPIKGVARWDEFAPIDEVWAENEQGQYRPTGRKVLDPKNQKNSFWRKMPTHMIAKCAEAVALRKGWPEDLAGVYESSEMDYANTIDLTATEIVEHAEEEQRLKAINYSHSIMIQWEKDKPLEAVKLGVLHDEIERLCHNATEPEEIELFQDINRASLNEFWARAKDDALHAKVLMEKTLGDLRKEREVESEQIS